MLRGRNGRIPVKLMEKSGGIAFLITSERLQLDDHAPAGSPPFPRWRSTEDGRPQVAARSRVGTGAATVWKEPPTIRPFRTISTYVGTHRRQRLAGIDGRRRAMTALPVGLFLAWDRSAERRLHVLATLFFFACVALRFAAVASIRPLLPPGRDDDAGRRKAGLFGSGRALPGSSASCRIFWPRWTGSCGRATGSKSSSSVEADDTRHLGGDQRLATCPALSR